MVSVIKKDKLSQIFQRFFDFIFSHLSIGNSKWEFQLGIPMNLYTLKKGSGAKVFQSSIVSVKSAHRICRNNSPGPLIFQTTKLRRPWFRPPPQIFMYFPPLKNHVLGGQYFGGVTISVGATNLTNTVTVGLHWWFSHTQHGLSRKALRKLPKPRLISLLKRSSKQY